MTSILGVLILLVGVFYVMLRRERGALEQDRQQFAMLEKEAMQDELDRLSEEYSLQSDKLSLNSTEMPLRPNNDSLLAQLIAERAKVDRLSQELKQVKASNVKRISELRSEVATLRGILRSYVEQVDSLHASNQRLIAENKEVKANYQAMAGQASQLKKEKDQLSDRVQLAAKLDAVNINVTLLDRRGRTVQKISRGKTLAMSFAIPKNITAEPGEKTIYARILTPSDELLTKNAGNLFPFEGKQLAYSARKVIEYGGEEMSVQIYWDIEEALMAGGYRVDFFADGHIIGQKQFSLKD